MSAPAFGLLAKRRFAPLFATQFLGAFNDNLFKTALLILASFGLYRADPGRAETLAGIATALFILPYFLLSAPAGQLADGRDKAKIAKWVKLAEVGIMGVGFAGFHYQSVPLLLCALTLMGVHSTVFGPVKYSILPQHLGPHEIMGGTGLVEAGTFLAILGGQILGGLLAPEHAGMAALAIAATGLLASLFIPPAPPREARLPIDLNIARSTWRLLREATRHRPVWLSILGISWFFALGAVFLAEFVPLVQNQLSARQEVAVLFLTVFSVGVAAGSVLVNKLLGGVISARFVPLSALLLSVFVIDLYFSVASYSGPAGASVPAFVAAQGAWRILIDLAGIALTAGMFVVPLYAILQTQSPPEERSRMIAANNIVNAAITVVVVGAATALIAAGYSVPAVLAVLGIANLGVALASCWLLPEASVKAMVRVLLRLFFRARVTGLEHYAAAGERRVVVVNHISFLDGLIVAAFLPGKPSFAIQTAQAKRWLIKPFLLLINAFPVDPTNPMATKAMVKAVREGRSLVIFPEGRITVTGALMKIFEGPGMVAEKADAMIVPVRLEGAQYTPFSRIKGKVRTRWFPRIEMTVLPPVRFPLPEGVSAKARRKIAAQRLYDLMSGLVFETSPSRISLFEALLDARRIHGASAPVVEDIAREPMGLGRLVAGSLALASTFVRMTERREKVGLLLPNSTAAVVSFFALQAIGRVPAMLNFTAGLANIRAACVAVEARTIITSRRFVEQGKLETLIAGLGADYRILYLEDVAKGIGPLAKLRAALASRFAGSLHRRHDVSPEEPAVILFTSGSEGLPKGVALSHLNLNANRNQLAARIDFNPSDVVLNALPMFHSFGLTGGTLLPILSGIKTVLYPSPLHYRIVPALAYDSNATIMFGTDTFLAGYARMASAYDFYALRYVFAGAEKVRDSTRATWGEKFGVRIMEGYGATEAAPVIAVNTPMHFRAGSVGRLLPGIEARLDPVPGIEEGGRLSIRGPNIMAGYYKSDEPGLLQPPAEGWHDTGDIVTIDEEGFVTIRGRAKRFAKIGGEMVSLPAVEGYAGEAWPGFDHAVVTRPDPRKGEQLVLYTTHAGADAKSLLEWGRANGVTELMLPRDIRVLPALPVLGTGKVDYVRLSEEARQSAGSDEAVPA
jgi:acyl-[acyl-carrier-protein]-phospholipid O-acyltransferase/long-chain-fatty-acid--[acyl-carrier-protein] ligase